MNALDPDKALRDDTAKLMSRLREGALRFVADSLGSTLAALGIVAIAAILAAVFSALEFVAVIGTVIVAIGCLLVAFYSRRSYLKERDSNKWREIRLAREAQKAARAEAAIHEACVALVEPKPAAKRGRYLRHYPSLQSAIRYANRLRRYSTATKSRHSTRAMKPPSVGGSAAKVDELSARIEMLEATIQTLAGATEPLRRTREDKYKKWREAKAASAEVRRRQRRGLTPTAESPELSLRLEHSSTGKRNISRKKLVTPEELAGKDPPVFRED